MLLANIEQGAVYNTINFMTVNEDMASAPYVNWTVCTCGSSRFFAPRRPSRSERTGTRETSTITCSPATTTLRRWGLNSCPTLTQRCSRPRSSSVSFACDGGNGGAAVTILSLLIQDGDEQHYRLRWSGGWGDGDINKLELRTSSTSGPVLQA